MIRRCISVYRPPNHRSQLGSSRSASRRSTVGCGQTDSKWTPTKPSWFGSERASSCQGSKSMRSNCSWTRYRSPHLCRTWAWFLTASSRWQIMSRLSVDPVSFNCARYVQSGGRWRQMPGKHWWMHSLWVDWTTATPCVRASMKACWTSCSISRMRLLDLSQTHGNTIISLLFFEICTGSQFVKESSSSWRPWSTNVSTVCVHPTLQRTAYCCLPLVVGSTCDRLADWNYLFQEHELWHLVRGLSRWQARGFGILCPLL